MHVIYSRILQIPIGDTSPAFRCSYLSPFLSGRSSCYVSTQDGGSIHSYAMPLQTSFVIILFLLPFFFFTSSNTTNSLWWQTALLKSLLFTVFHASQLGVCAHALSVSQPRDSPPVSTHSTFPVRIGWGYICLPKDGICPVIAFLCSSQCSNALNGILSRPCMTWKPSSPLATLRVWSHSPPHSPQRGYFRHIFLLTPSPYSVLYEVIPANPWKSFGVKQTWQGLCVQALPGQFSMLTKGRADVSAHNQLTSRPKVTNKTGALNCFLA